MLKEYQRIDRIANLIFKELTAVLKKEIADPKLRLITVTSVKVSKDLAFADILFTQLELVQDEQSKDLALKRVKKAAPRLRYELAQRIKLRVMPTLRFYYDNSNTERQYLHDLIDTVITKDKTRRSS